MPSTYTPQGIQKMATGEKAGTWGTLTNTNWDIIEQIAGGYLSKALSTTGATTLAVSDGAAGAMLTKLGTRIIKFDSGTLNRKCNCNYSFRCTQGWWI